MPILAHFQELLYSTSQSPVLYAGLFFSGPYMRGFVKWFLKTTCGKRRKEMKPHTILLMWKIISTSG